MHFFSLKYTGCSRNIAYFLVTNNIIYAEFVVERKCVASGMSHIYKWIANLNLMLVIRNNLNMHNITKIRNSWNNPLFKEKFIFLKFICKVNTVGLWIQMSLFYCLSYCFCNQVAIGKIERISAKGDLYWSFICVL